MAQVAEADAVDRELASSGKVWDVISKGGTIGGMAAGVYVFGLTTEQEAVTHFGQADFIAGLVIGGLLVLVAMVASVFQCVKFNEMQIQKYRIKLEGVKPITGEDTNLRLGN